MRITIATIQGADIVLYRSPSHEIVDFVADADIDCDGSGTNPDHDPYFQPDTRLHYKGHALNAEVVPYVVVPPVVLAKTRGIVLGSCCIVTNLLNMRAVEAVVGDSGPKNKVGELSPAAAVLLGLAPNANHGGTSEFVINYRILVGVRALVNGVTYDLQPA